MSPPLHVRRKPPRSLAPEDFLALGVPEAAVQEVIVTENVTIRHTRARLVVIRGGSVALLENERDEWELPGGKPEPFELPEACVAREISEELLRVEAARILDTRVYEIAPEVRVLIVTYGCSEVGGADAAQEPRAQAAPLVPLAEASALRVADGYKTSIAVWAARWRSRARR